MSKMEQFVLSFPWVRAEQIPFARLGKPLAECKIALVSTGGIYGPGDTAYAISNSTDVDESYREIPLGVPLSELHVAHEHFNKTYSAQDMNVIFPVERLQALAEAGVIGQVAETNYSVTGYIPRPEQLFASAKAIAGSMLAQGVDAALIVPVWPVCQQSGGLVAREIEQAGISTVTLNLIPDIVSIIGIPRALNLRNPFGCTLGAPGNAEQHLRVLKEAIGLLVSADTACTMVRSEEHYRPVSWEVAWQWHGSK